MTRLSGYGLSLCLFLVALPLISYGSVSDRPLAWGIGLALVTIGAALPLVGRYVSSE